VEVIGLSFTVAAPHQGVPGQMPWQKYLRPYFRPSSQKW